MKNLKIGIRIGLGFGVVLCIALALGLATIMSMRVLSVKTDMLEAQVAPTMSLSASLERACLLTIIEMRSFSYTGKESYYKAATKNMEEMKNSLSKASELAGRREPADKLREEVEAAKSKALEFETLAQEAHRLEQEKAAQIKAMDDAALEYQQSCQAYWDNQNATLGQILAKAIPEGTEAIACKDKLAQGMILINLGGRLRLANSQSQLQRDPLVIRNAMGLFDEIDSVVAGLRRATEQDKNIRLLERIEAAKGRYREGMKRCLEGFSAQQINVDKRSKIVPTLIATAASLAKSGIQDVTDVSAAASGSVDQSTRLLLWGLLAAIVVGTATSVIVIRGITRPLGASVEFARGRGRRRSRP